MLFRSDLGAADTGLRAHHRADAHRKQPAPRASLPQLAGQVVDAELARRLSTGAAGSVRGGDRLPWVPDVGGGDNFAPLASLDWQVHVYGAPPNAIEPACRELGIPLHRFSWTADADRAGLLRGALYLVRPDGYVGLADAQCDVGALRQYVADWELALTNRN